MLCEKQTLWTKCKPYLGSNRLISRHLGFINLFNPVRYCTYLSFVIKIHIGFPQLTPPVPKRI